MKCKISNCNNTNILAKGLCNAHYLRLKRYGRSHSVKREYGTGGFRKDGYKIISVDGVRVLEHRYIMEKFLGRQLTPQENIHHINHNRSDNIIENLELVGHGEHRSRHIGEYRKPFSEQALKNIGKAQKKTAYKHIRDPLTGHYISSKT